MRDYKIFAAISDIHIGAKHISSDDMKKQLKKHFFKTLEKLYRLDAVFVCGDILHTQLSLSSDYSEVYIWFISRLYMLAKKRKCTVIIIRGTLSHDVSIDAIKPFEQNAVDDGIDFRIYDTVEEITIWDNYKILVLPDVKVKQLKEIDEYLDQPKKYDLILGHGTIDTMQFFVQESELIPTKTYVYDVDKLISCSKGPILFGHIHQYQSILDHFYYLGSFTTLERGVRNAGFVIGGIYNKDREKFVVNRYQNPDSAEYYNLTVSKSMLSEYPIDDIISEIDDILSGLKENDLVTLRITRGDERSDADKVLMLEERYRKDRRVSIVKKVKTKQEELVEEENKALRDKYSYAWDQGLQMYEITWRYYQDDILPTLDPSSNLAKLTIEDFKRVLEK